MRWDEEAVPAHEERAPPQRWALFTRQARTRTRPARELGARKSDVPHRKSDLAGADDGDVALSNAIGLRRG
jgi:hypothetical protein